MVAGGRVEILSLVSRGGWIPEFKRDGAVALRVLERCAPYAHRKRTAGKRVIAHGVLSDFRAVLAVELLGVFLEAGQPVFGKAPDGSTRGPDMCLWRNGVGVVEASGLDDKEFRT